MERKPTERWTQDFIMTMRVRATEPHQWGNIPEWVKAEITEIINLIVEDTILEVIDIEGFALDMPRRADAQET